MAKPVNTGTGWRTKGGEVVHLREHDLGPGRMEYSWRCDGCGDSYGASSAMKRVIGNLAAKHANSCTAIQA